MTRVPTDLCRYCGSTYDLVHGHTCTPLTATTSTGGDYARDQVGVDPTAPAVAEVKATADTAGPPDSAFDLDWDDDDGRTPPLLERVPWRIGVLDKDLIEDPDAIVENAAWIAGWYVHDCAELLGLVQELSPPEVAVAGPPDLDHAIQAAKHALWDNIGPWNIQKLDFEVAANNAARAAVEAAAPVLLQAMQERHNNLAGMIREWHEECIRLERELQATRDRLALCDRNWEEAIVDRNRLRDRVHLLERKRTREEGG